MSYNKRLIKNNWNMFYSDKKVNCFVKFDRQGNRWIAITNIDDNNIHFSKNDKLLSYYPENSVNEDERRNYSKAYARRKKKTVISAYGGKCECCNEDRIEFLSIDHVNGGGSKERRIKGMKGFSFYLHLIKSNFPSGYRVLCHNCNFSLGIYGYCPHQKV